MQLPKLALMGGFLALSLGVWEKVSAKELAALPEQGFEAIASGEARPVAAWYKFCEKFPEECAVNTNEPFSLVLTPRIWTVLNEVNQRINADIRPVTDEEHWGIVDRWSFPDDGTGDCEDYQLLKRKKLVEAGLSRRALRMTVVIDEKGEGHAVLMVRTDRGDLVLDNKTDRILPWHETGYVYVKREGHDNLRWVSLGGAISPTITANR